MTRVPFWHFWDPLSGAAGGVIMACALTFVPILIVFGLTNN